MNKRIQNLREQPHHVRERVAYGSAAGIALAVFLVWGVSFVVSEPFAYDQENQRNIADSEATRPFTELTQTFQAGLAGASAAFGDTQEPSRDEGEARLEVVNTGAQTSVENEEPQNVYTF